ncbi:MAG: tetratricopeptide repeat protein [Actinomycetota bacterium]
MKLRFVTLVTAIVAASLVAGAVAPFGASDTRRPLKRAERRAQSLAVDALGLIQLSRDEAEPSYLPVARRRLERSLILQPEDNFAAFVGMASLSNASHDFSSSVTWARRAIRVNPYNASPYGLLGDALFELGRTRRSDVAYQKMIDRRPDVASYVRASYSAQSHRRWGAALRAMSLAIQAAPPLGEQAAWLRHQRGDIYATLGRYGRALRENRIGQRLAPGYIPPTVGAAEALIKLGRLEEAVPIMERAVEELPAVEYLVTLGNAYRKLGRDRLARTVYDRAAVRLAHYRRNGVLPDVDFILFYAHRGYRLRKGLEEAHAVFADRPTAAAANALAWMLHANSRDRAAARYARIAVAGGSRGARRLLD